MAIQDDIDICLNVTEGSNGSSKKILEGKHVKCFNKNCSQETSSLFPKLCPIDSDRSMLEERIKLKSLAATVATCVQGHGQHKEEPAISFLKKPNSGIHPKSVGPRYGSKRGWEKAFDRISFCQEDDPNGLLVHSTKKMANNVIQNVSMVKKRDATSKLKKSLSKTCQTNNLKEERLLQNHLGNDGESNYLKNEGPSIPHIDLACEQIGRIATAGMYHTDLMVSRNKKQGLMIAKERLRTTATVLSDGKSTKKFARKISDGKRRKDVSMTSNDGCGNPHSSGKISSLFGNNPEVPYIGQRLVRPVNENVFTADTFSDLNIHKYSVLNLEKNMEISKMTTVQKKAIPVILSGYDVLVKSQTGSGKTLSYALPIVEKLQKIRPKLLRNSGIRALVILPTRELALQTYECFLKLVKPFTWIVPGCLVGGGKRKAEKARLRKGCTILVATPGRLLDHIKNTEALRLDVVEIFVLDEADRMLDMGYERDISGILDELNNTKSGNHDDGYDALELLRLHVNPKVKLENSIDYETIKIGKGRDVVEYDGKCGKLRADDECDPDGEHSSDTHHDSQTPLASLQETSECSSCTTFNPRKRQTILLSATLTHAVEKLAGLSMDNSILVDAAKGNINTSSGNCHEVDGDLIVPGSVSQSYVVTPPKLRMVTLSSYIVGKFKGHASHKIIVFMATQDMVDYHTDILSLILSKPVDGENKDSGPPVDIEFFKLHGSMSQKMRTEIFNTFRQTQSGILLCTDVAARGLDLPKVDTIVQYTGPMSLRDYVHRIGRTARVGSRGVAIIFLTPPEIEFVRMLEEHRIIIKRDDMDNILTSLLGTLSNHNSVQVAAVVLQNDFEQLVHEDRKFHDLACKAFTSWVRFYSSYPREMRNAFDRYNLHLGHYAKSFALRDSPQRIGLVGKLIREQQQAQQLKPKRQVRLSHRRDDEMIPKKDLQTQSRQEHRPGMLKRVKMLSVSEHGNGFESASIKKPCR